MAIKVLPPMLALDPQFRERFEREAEAFRRSIGRTSAPHDVGNHEGTEYLVMEFLDGETLAARLAQGDAPAGRRDQDCG